MALNVNRSIVDPFYRYKMPCILVKVVGKGNGTKTVLANINDIAKSLKRPVSYIIKYFGYELGAQTKVDVKNECYIVNGEHDAGKLQNLLDVFIRKFVLCPVCDNPETILDVCRKCVNSKCKACGHSFVMDPEQKMSTFIIKNAQQCEKEGEEKKVIANEQISCVNVSSNNLDDADDWAPETIHNKLFTLNIGNFFITKDLEKSTGERLNILYHFFMKKKVLCDIGDGKEFIHEAERLRLKHKAPLLLVNVLFDQNIITDNQIEENQRLLCNFTLGDKKAQRYLLGGIEQLIVKHNKLLSRAALIIKTLYDVNIVEEDTLITWSEKPSSKFVSKALAKKIIENCALVINWLKEAEEESDDENDALKFGVVKVSSFAKVIAERLKNEIKRVDGDDGRPIDIDDI